MSVSQPSPLDSESFSSLFTRTHLIIYRFIYGLHGGPTVEVEDMTSDTYIRAWKRRKFFSGDEHDALCWLFTIARHLVIDAHRKMKSHPDTSIDSLDESTLDEWIASPHASPEIQVANREQFIYLWRLLMNLPLDRREMLVLRYMVGWQVNEIAKYLEMHENTVSVYIRRSLEQIRRDWKES